MFGFFETIVEYYTGRDASLMSDQQLANKVAQIKRIRKMEESTINEQIKTMLNG